MKNEKIFSTFLIPALVVGIFGFVSAVSVLAATAPTTTSIDNVAPVFTVTPSDNGSNTTTPTNVGDNVTFTADATDANLDEWFLAICKTAAVTAGTDAAPTCDGGAWAISTATTSGNSATVTYTALGPDVETNAWSAYACDKNLSGACGTLATGTDTPFEVNHQPTFGATAITDITDGDIQPDEATQFEILAVNIADADTSGTQDFVQLFVCDAATTAFDYSTNTCTGGALICSSSSVDPTTTAVTCTDAAKVLTSIPTAHGSYGVSYFLEDAHSFDGTGTESQTVPVTDVASTLSSYSTSDSVTIAAGGSDGWLYSVVINDDNGDRDPTSVKFLFFDDDVVNDTCTADDNNCIIYPSEDPASPGSGCTVSDLSASGGVGTKTELGSDATVTLVCDFELWFNFNATSNAEVAAFVTDGTGVADFANDNNNNAVASLSAIAVSEASIPYGTLSPGGTSTFQTTTMQNLGNTPFDVLISGTNMTVATFTIDAADQEWHNSGIDFTYGSGSFELVTSAIVGADADGCSNRDMGVRDGHLETTLDEILSWILGVNVNQETGSYTGTNTLATTDSGDCTGILY